jgi:exosortase D (VPLPA-CTERM-specific)
VSSPIALDRASSERLPVILIGCALIALLLFDFSSSLGFEIEEWSRDEYSYGYLSPFVALLIARHSLIRTRPVPKSSWVGFVVLFIAVVLQAVGDLTAVHLVVQYAFLIALFGLILTVAGSRVAALSIWALFYLVLAVPLPSFLYVALSTKMQLLSSTLGVDTLHLLGLSVFQEGNIIDLGGFKLQVAEACSGLRYLFPLVSFGYLAACLLDDSWWKRAILLISTTPITIVMNSLRIAAIGITVDKWGIAMAEGLLHGFEGWVVFLLCVAILMVEMSILVRIGHRGRIRFDYLSIGQGPNLGGPIRISAPMIAASLVLIVAAAGIGSGWLSARQEITPKRHDFAQFPLRLGTWTGRPDSLNNQQLDSLKLDDYVLIDFRSEKYSVPVNFYVAYYASQRKGESAHSPQTCIPGGGWEITELTQRPISGFDLNGSPLVVDRVIIQKGEIKQLVYYWFQQRGRIMTNEYVVKWNIMVDALRRDRTDGALVRLVTPISPDESEASADDRLKAMLASEWGILGDYIPN